MPATHKPQEFSGIIFITGTDTGAGKTAFTALLLAHLREHGVHALAMKPFCSGSRGDVRLLQSLQRGELRDDEMNPFYYDVPLAPFIAAQQGCGPHVTLREAIQKIAAIKKKCAVLLVEGSGGLFVPLGRGFCVMDLVESLDCFVAVSGWNKIGILNHSTGAIKSIQSVCLKQVACVLINKKKRDFSSLFNPDYLRLKNGKDRVFELPFFDGGLARAGQVKRGAKKVKKVLARFWGAAILSLSSMRKTGLLTKKHVDGRRGGR
jgi:dethiobiotin synthetase